MTRPMISPSLHWTGPWSFPELLHLLVLHQQVPIPTNTSTERLLLWDGDQLVTENRIICIIGYSYYLFIELIELITIFEFFIFSRWSSKHRLQTGKSLDFAQ
jgi:hypothetical protein